MEKCKLVLLREGKLWYTIERHGSCAEEPGCAADLGDMISVSGKNMRAYRRVVNGGCNERQREKCTCIFVNRRTAIMLCIRSEERKTLL